MPRSRLILLAALLIVAAAVALWSELSPRLARKAEPSTVLATVQATELGSRRCALHSAEDRDADGREVPTWVGVDPADRSSARGGGSRLGLARPPGRGSREKDGTVNGVYWASSKISNVAIDEKDTQAWDRTKTWWTPWVPYSLDLEKRARILGLEEAEKSAIEMGILTASEKNAETSVRSLLSLAGVKAVTIVPTT